MRNFEEIYEKMNKETAQFVKDRYEFCLSKRKAFEEKGYKVEWTANDKPIVISNDKVKAEVTIGSNKVVVDGDMVYEISVPVELIDGVTYVTSDALELF